jgi:hypothetical protein
MHLKTFVFLIGTSFCALCRKLFCNAIETLPAVFLIVHHMPTSLYMKVYGSIHLNREQHALLYQGIENPRPVYLYFLAGVYDQIYEDS